MGVLDVGSTGALWTFMPEANAYATGAASEVLRKLRREVCIWSLFIREMIYPDRIIEFTPDNRKIMSWWNCA